MKLRAKKKITENKWLAGIGIAIGVGALVAGVATLLMGRRNSEKPPRNAPQLDIDNPGTQADFLTSASESEIG